jgi:hypothetical protein
MSKKHGKYIYKIRTSVCKIYLKVQTNVLQLECQRGNKNEKYQGY